MPVLKGTRTVVLRFPSTHVLGYFIPCLRHSWQRDGGTLC